MHKALKVLYKTGKYASAMMFGWVMFLALVGITQIQFLNTPVAHATLAFFGVYSFWCALCEVLDAPEKSEGE